MAINLSTAGVHLLYAVEKEVGTKPTTGFIDLKGVKTIPSMNPAPETIETTSLNETEWKTYVDGLKDLGGALEFTFNLTQELIEKWGALMEAYETAKAANKAVWFLVYVPGLTNNVYFTGNPSEIGLPEMSVSSVMEVTNYITPTNAPEWDTKPSDISTSIA